MTEPIEQAGRHAGQTEEKGSEGDLVDGLERGVQRRKPAVAAGFGLEPALLNQVQQRGEQRDNKRSVRSEKERDVEEDPAGADGRGERLLSGTERGERGKNEDDGENEDSEGDAAVAARRRAERPARG